MTLEVQLTFYKRLLLFTAFMLPLVAINLIFDAFSVKSLGKRYMIGEDGLDAEYNYSYTEGESEKNHLRITLNAQSFVDWKKIEPPASKFNETVKSMERERILSNGEDSTLPLCRREEIREGKWVPITLEKAPYVSKTKHLRCPPSDDENFDPEAPWKTWDWKPTASERQLCQLSSWNATEFCKLLPVATVSIIGDSLSWEHYSSLLQLLGARVRQNSQHESKKERRNHVQLACGDKNGSHKTKFVFRNDPRITVDSLIDSIHNDFPLVLILNRGAHYKNDTELISGIQSILPILLEWQETCRDRLGLKCHLFWRTTVPGHPFCSNFAEPVNDLAAMEQHVEQLSNYDNNTINYHWYDFKRQNMLILEELEQANLENFEVIDAYDINMLRPDGHRWYQGDCLHNSYPGKMDVYNQLLLHYLKNKRSNAEVQHLVDLYERHKRQMRNASNAA